MMRRETAYKLAGRKHQHGNALDEAHCHHEMRFAAEPADQAGRALTVLQQLAWLRVEHSRQADTLSVRYDLSHHSLRELEAYLEEQGFTLDNSWVSRIRRSLAHFCEDTQTRNAASPQRLIKQSNQVYVKAYEQHPHGDHDDTPVELREIK
ncbi:hypothetical protein Q9Q94_09520 [Uliginosibacterium sp. 31-16]|uniref:hypothetical protein n=1 Tax=Uliginosibacterium sp. 31-16 TaxID=3068315 RepID=UPI00273DAE88|nr:hypothetical protein [Uliginosibacterium sp. 31-16]MDP5239770.1 hypothetical protein [Uliginosibacterium sp. 31-16]